MKVSRSKRGFTLVEIMIVVAIIGLLSALSIPNVFKAGQRTRSIRFAKDIQTASHAFMEYSLETGSYPSDKTPGIMPTDMAPYLTELSWLEETTIGGKWDWDYDVFGVTAAVSVTDPKWDDDLMTEIDVVLDDGNLSTGEFRKRSGGYMYIIE